MIIAVTGHRPKDCISEQDVRQKARNKIRYTKGVDTIICGMAAGVDLWVADEALDIGKAVWAAVPWYGHEARVEDLELYQRVIDCAEKIVYVTEVQDYPGPQVYHARNQWMVDNSDVVMAYWNPDKTSGGTYACRQYAKKVGKPVANIYMDAPF